MAATNPYAYGAKSIMPVIWDTTDLEPIEWAHALDWPVLFVVRDP